MDSLHCDCGTFLYLTFKNYKFEHAGKELVIRECPILECPECSSYYVYEPAENRIKKFMENRMRRRKGYLYANECFNISSEDFIESAVDFNYNPWDYYFIPGLFRPQDDGFLTPVFFNMEVLLKYTNYPNYSLELGANSSGNIYKEQVPIITFGINRNNNVIMWLGDLARLEEDEQRYLKSENIESDHDIASDFYIAQIEARFPERSDEKKLLHRRLLFSEKILTKYNIDLSHLEKEALKEAKNIIKPLINTEDAVFEVIESLNKVLVESINVSGFKEDIRTIDQDCNISRLGSLKTFEMWLDKRIQIQDSSSIVSPLFVLYDLRKAASHLLSEENKDDNISFCCQRLDLPENCRDYLKIYNSLIKELISMFNTLEEEV